VPYAVGLTVPVGRLEQGSRQVALGAQQFVAAWTPIELQQTVLGVRGRAHGLNLAQIGEQGLGANAAAPAGTPREGVLQQPRFDQAVATAGVVETVPAALRHLLYRLFVGLVAVAGQFVAIGRGTRWAGKIVLQTHMEIGTGLGLWNGRLKAGVGSKTARRR
jgi:hypothetical protein